MHSLLFGTRAPRPHVGLWLLLAAVLRISSVSAQPYHVAPAGSDANPGTRLHH
jgi:hypothetical protein